MSVIRWKDCYSTGISQFDEEHKQLVALINELYEAIRADRDHVDLHHILEELLGYTGQHFKHEEALMEKLEYPGFPEHREAHKALSNKIQEMRNHMEDGDTEMPLALYAFLRDWLLKHVVGVDQKYGDFFREKGVS